MANSQSLNLLPPQPAAVPTSEQSTSKPSKPTQGKSFGHKLDTAKKQIAAKVPEAKPAAIAVKAAVKPVTKTAQDKSDEEESTDENAEGATTKPVIKLPKSLIKQSSDDLATEDDHETDSATKVVEPTAVKTAVPAKSSADRTKKAVKANDPKAVVKSDVVQPVPTKAAADQALKPDDESEAESKESASAAEKVGSDSKTESTDETDSAGNQLYGSGKVVGKGNPGDVNSPIVNGVGDATDEQDAADNAASDLDPVATAADDIATSSAAPVVKVTTDSDSHTPGVGADVTGLISSTSGQSPAAIAGKTAAASTAASPQARFAEDNHPKIITGIQGELLPKGGTMQLQLNPADLGALQVTVHMQDGVVSASFETSNDTATKMLSHSLGQLKSGLEAAGVSVEKLHVEQAPQKDASGDSNSESDSKSPLQDQQRQAQQDQQRKDMVQRMWRRLAGGSDPLDLVA